MKIKTTLLILLYLAVFQSFIGYGFNPKTTIGHIRNKGLQFIENKGQWNKNVLYRARIPMGTLFLEKNTLTYVLVDPEALSFCHHSGNCENENGNDADADRQVNFHALKMNFLGAGNHVKPLGNQKFKEYFNFFLGNDPAAWVSFVNGYGSVVYPDLYPGISLQLGSSGINLKYEFLLQAGAEPGLINIEYQGADKMYLDDGKLVLKTSVNDLIEQTPFAYQLIQGDTVKVPCHFRLSNNKISFILDQNYRHDLPLVIDPVVVASTYAGTVGSSTYGHSATYDNDGYIYTGGRSFGPGYPTTTGAFQTVFSGQVDIAISKFLPDGSDVVWATYIGGSESDYAHSLIVNNNSELFIYGSSYSTNYPVTTGCYQPANAGTCDIIITHLNASGSALIGSTYIGGSGSDGQNSLSVNYGDTYRGEIILDSQGNPCVASFASSNNFPTTTGAFDQTYNGGQDAVVFKIDSSLTSLIWSTYLGGSLDDAAYGLKLNSVDMVYVAGGTTSTNFPTTEWVLSPYYNGGTHDGFMCIFQPDMSSMIAGSFFGTPAFDEIFFIQMDNDNNVYIYGQSEGDIPVTTGFYGNPGSYQFIVKLDQTLNGIIYSTVFGDGTKTGKLTPTAFLVDLCQNVYAAGWGNTADFPVSANAVQPTTDGSDFYLMALKHDGQELLYATYYGSPTAWEHVDGGTSRFDKRGIIYEAVCAGGSGFPTTPNAYATFNSTSWDLAVFKIDFQLSGPTAAISANPGTTGCAPFTVNFINNSVSAVEYLWDFGDGTPHSTQVNPTHTFILPGNYTVSCIAIDSNTCFISDTAFLDIIVLAPPVVNLGTDTLMCGIDSLVLDAGNSGVSFLWSNNSLLQTLTVTTPGTYWVKVNNGYCLGNDTITVDFMGPPELGPDQTVCEGVSVTLDAGMPGYQFHWITGDSTQTILVTHDSLYWVEVIKENCVLRDSVKVNVNPLPIVDLGADRFICEGESVLLDAGNPGGFFTWNTGLHTQQINAYTTGIFWVSVTVNGCSSVDTVRINVVPVPNVNLLGNRILCEGDTLALDAGFPGYSYRWSTGDTLQQILIHDSGYYSVTVSAQGCSGSDTIYAEQIILRVNLGNDTLACPGQSILLDAGNDGANYLWNTGETTRTKVIRNNGLFWVRVSRYQCSATDSIHIDYMQDINLPELLNLCGNEYLTLDAGIEADHYEWSNGYNTPSITITESGTYVLLAEKGHCTLEDSTLVIGKSGISTFYLPNSFTPNADGKNDNFTAKGTDIIFFHMLIFDRWGTLLCEINDLETGWDGSYKGTIVQSGVYFYVIQYATECSFDQKFQKTGYIILLR